MEGVGVSVRSESSEFVGSGKNLSGTLVLLSRVSPVVLVVYTQPYLSVQRTSLPLCSSDPLLRVTVPSGGLVLS